jgi:hypothetical protein
MRTMPIDKPSGEIKFLEEMLEDVGFSIRIISTEW